MMTSQTVSSFARNLTIYDFNCVKVIVDGDINSSIPPEFFNELGDECVAYVSAPSEKTLIAAGTLSQLDHYFTLIGNVAPLKGGSGGNLAQMWRRARATTNETNFLYNEQYSPYTIYFSPTDGILLLYVLQGDQHDSEELRKAVESDDQLEMCDAATEHGLVSLLVFVPSKVGSKVTRILLTGTCTGSRVMEGLRRAAGRIPWMEKEFIVTDSEMVNKHFTFPDSDRDTSPTPSNEQATLTLAKTPQKQCIADCSSLASPAENQKLPRYLSQTKSTNAKRRMSSVNTTPEQEPAPKSRRRYSLAAPIHVATPMPSKITRRGLEGLQSLKNSQFVSATKSACDGEDQPLGYFEVIHLPSEMRDDETTLFLRKWQAATYFIPSDKNDRNLLRDKTMVLAVTEGIRRNALSTKVRIVPTHYSPMVRFLSWCGLATLDFCVSNPIYSANEDMVTDHEDNQIVIPGSHFELNA